MLGNVVRYHRGGRPKKEHRSYASLTRPQQRTLWWLSGILRVSDALDRSHSQPISKVEVTVTAAEISIRAVADEPAHLERWAVERRVALLERMAQRPVAVRVVQPLGHEVGPPLRSTVADQLE